MAVKLPKKPFGVVEFAIGTLFAGFFCALALSDLSASLFFSSQAGSDASAGATGQRGALGFAEYVRWKNQAPLIGPIILGVALLLPLVVFGLVKDVIGIFTRAASVRRHVIDLCHLVLLSTVLFVVIAKVKPTEQLLLEAATKSVNPEVFAQLHDHLTVFYAIVCSLNLLMMVLPFLRWSDEAKSAPAVAAAASVQERPKKD